MNLKDIIIVGVALAMDAVGVSISIGVNSAINKKNKIEFIISFAFFQFLFFFLGKISGNLFETYITAIPNVIGGIAIAIVGILMISDGFENKENDRKNVIKKRSSVNIRSFSKYRCICNWFYRIWLYQQYNTNNF